MNTRSTLVAAPLAAVLSCAAALLIAAPAPAAAADMAWGRSATVGSGNVVSQMRQVSDFQALKVSGSVDVRVRQTGREAVEVKVDDNVQPLVETVVEVEGGIRTLHVRWKRDANLRIKNNALVTVEVARLSALAILGSGDVTVDTLKTPTLAVSLSGSGDARLTGLDADMAEVSISGSGDVRAAGRATRLKIGVAGSGDVQMLDLKADEVSVSIAGSGDVAVHADKTLDVSIAGSGDVVYAGAAAVRSSVAGSGSISRRK
jgi:Putative auto-transporter adhesin, head GIN domain